MPAVSICTQPFVPAAQAMAKVYGFSGYQFVTMPHPLASLDESQIEARVADMMPGVLRILGMES